ncbi:ribosomal protein 63, mitochondrial [Hyla sarda]|uniref:ribosomal protein 63, mitochondrial n=1 Tax=Hyla sarda TaxID=327740 RepID=UPI0024C241EB|nr:ribosomal protein 63, mitochondrial [Hyla sarda]XP_056424219.1 ribosomal protein 63, mitochondrial [Hyla sarda]XP_056424220.1 ribosomal protein 63, mitochondrial [Hyla sarda]XP_056424221.1 ribosomal protein 63, mitochondrial [Hyla sarda]XP_056424222.1 ribosomal protein 63, mitochondrial [Hyla sarda]
MFLTNFLLRKGIPGRQWIGKYRRPREVTWNMKQSMIKRLEIEAETEYWISRPYMTKEQEFRHAAERKHKQYLELKAKQEANFPDHKYLQDHLDHLNVTKKWTMS